MNRSVTPEMASNVSDSVSGSPCLATAERPETGSGVASFGSGKSCPLGDSASDPVLMRRLAAEFPAVTAVRVKDALEAVNTIVEQLATAIRGASGLAITASLLVLGGALAAGQRARLYDAMILKTLGATRRFILSSYALEYAAIGLVAALFGVVAGTAAGWGVVTQVMRIDFVSDPTGALLAATAAIAVTILFGLAGTIKILSKAPASHLRNL